MNAQNPILFALGLASVGTLCSSACGDDGSASGAEGGGGAGGAPTSTASSASSTSAGAGGVGGEGGSTLPPPCELAEADDRTREAEVTIGAQGIFYSTRCFVVSAGTQVTFAIDFEDHPLVGGEVVDGVGVEDPSSPIERTESGTTATFLLDVPGEYPFYCEYHASIGMYGTVFVE